MKKIQISNKLHLLYIGAMAAIMTLNMASCQQEDAMPTDDNDAQGELVQFNIGKPAGFVGVGNDTRTVIADDGTVTWEDGDKVYVVMAIGEDSNYTFRNGTLTYSGGSWNSDLRWPLDFQAGTQVQFLAWYLGRGEGSGLGQELYQHQIYNAMSAAKTINDTSETISLLLAPTFAGDMNFNQFVFTGLTEGQTVTLATPSWYSFKVTLQENNLLYANCPNLSVPKTFTADASGQIVLYLHTSTVSSLKYSIDNEEAVNLRDNTLIAAALTAQPYGNRFIINCGAPASGGTGAGDIEAAAAAKQEFLDWYNGGASTDFTLSGDITLQSGDITSVQHLTNNQTFDGAGFTITGLNITIQNAVVGLFGVNNGTIKNLIIKDATISGDYAGAIIGQNAGRIISCQSINCILTGSGSAGGIAAINSGTIVACYESGSTISGAEAGGIAAYNDAGTILACYAQSATITSGYETPGGILGYNVDTSSITTACYWQHGTITNGIGDNRGIDGTVKSNYADCYGAMNTALTGAGYSAMWGATGLVYP
ncbi:hypothetical protein D0T50_10465 [Bacteroides sp. 214]|uniref:hypothetical protein n=1 Tax=Bacteroides sp. 214 TaxID=2302935 RepID=UPI0013D56365|nr:hypothetical protein [Bacteroides sp. 214]NDW13313.1 hypothetical protein [Bacteroides sp. 214]